MEHNEGIQGRPNDCVLRQASSAEACKMEKGRFMIRKDYHLPDCSEKKNSYRFLRKKKTSQRKNNSCCSGDRIRDQHFYEVVAWSSELSRRLAGCRARPRRFDFQL